MDVSTHGGNGEWFINFEDDNDSDGSANRGLLLQANGTDLK